MNSTSSLIFVWTPWALILGVLLVAATTFVCFMAWRRSGFARGTGALEGLRLLVVALIAVTLNQPEWLEQYRPDEQPTLVVLVDESRSMQTRDVIDQARPSPPPQRRAEVIQPLLQQPLWQPAAQELDVVFERFASADQAAQQGTDLHAALAGAARKYPHLRAVVLLSDGDWNLGDPPAQAANQLRMKNVPVYPIGVGSESRMPDVELVRADAPTFGVVGKPLRIPVVIDSSLPRDAQLSVTLQSSDGAEVSKQVTLPAMNQLEDVLVWKPEQKGDFELTFSVPVQDGEVSTENNQQVVPITIREETIKILLVESVPRWEYRYLRNALERDPSVEVACLLLHPGLSKVGGGKNYLSDFPEDLESLSQYDVIFLGDVGVADGELTVEQCRLLHGLIKNQASGLILMPGLRGGHRSLSGTDLEELYPVVLDAAQPRGWGSRIPAQLELTDLGRRSLLTKLADDEDDNATLWESLPGFQWHAPVVRAKVGTQVLARHKSESNQFGRIPLLVTKTYGTGKILFMGTDGAWRWREGVEDLYHYRFWGQVARWMAYQRSMAQGELMRLFYSPDRPQADDVVVLNANVMSSAGEPLQNGTVIVQIVAPSGKSESVRLKPAGEEWGLFSGSFTPAEAGSYQLKLVCRENGTSLDAKLAVQGIDRERIGRPARMDVLEEIASITRGTMTDRESISALIKDLAELPEPEPIVRRLRLWSHPLWAGIVIFLLGMFWIGRKMNGTI